MIVEARTAGGSNWTTLPEVGGLTSSDSPEECDGEDSFLLNLHPFLETYLGTDCNGAGATGEWHAILDSTDGWTEVAYNLSGFAGSQVEVSISYVTDPATGGVGAFGDDTRVVVNGAVDADGFEGATSDWTPTEEPPRSPPSPANWRIGPSLVNFLGGVATEDSLLLGFGLEHLSTDAERADLVERALDGPIE